MMMGMLMRNLPACLGRGAAIACIMLMPCLLGFLPNAYADDDRLDCPDCGIDLIQVIPQGGNNPFDTTDPTAGGDTVGTIGAGGGVFNFALITTPTGFFQTSIAGGFGTCGGQASSIAFNGSILAMSPFYANGGQQIGFVSFTVSGNVATSMTALTVPGIPNDTSTCTLTPSDANTLVVQCRGNIFASMCNDTWIRF